MAACSAARSDYESRVVPRDNRYFIVHQPGVVVGRVKAADNRSLATNARKARLLLGSFVKRLEAAQHKDRNARCVTVSNGGTKPPRFSVSSRSVSGMLGRRIYLAQVTSMFAYYYH